MIGYLKNKILQEKHKKCKSNLDEIKKEVVSVKMLFDRLRAELPREAWDRYCYAGDFYSLVFQMHDVEVKMIELENTLLGNYYHLYEESRKLMEYCIERVESCKRSAQYISLGFMKEERDKKQADKEMNAGLRIGCFEVWYGKFKQDFASGQG